MKLEIDSSARPSCTPEGQDRYQYGDASDPGVPCCEGLFENKVLYILDARKLAMLHRLLVLLH